MTRSNNPRLSSRQIFFLAALFFFALPCWPQWEKKTPPPPPPKILPPGITLTDITAKLHLTLPAIEHPQNSQTLLKLITPSEYSLELARNVLIPAIGGSTTAVDLDGSGYSDLYVVVPGGSNHFFHNLHNGTFADVMLFSTGQFSNPYSVAVGDFNNDKRMDIVVANRNTDNVSVINLLIITFYK